MKEIYKCRGYLFCLYELLGKSTTQIAKECGASASTIWYWLRKFSIKIRTISETNKGIKNPMYGRTGVNAPMYGRTGVNSPLFGKHRSKETKKKISDTRKGKYDDENHPRWKGNEAGNVAIHQWVAKHKPLPEDDKCEICYQITNENGITKLELSNIKVHQYTRNIDDYQWTHHSCHMIYDAEKRKSN